MFKSLDSLLMVCLRIHLVPKRKVSHLEMVTRMADIKKETQKMQKEERTSESRRQWKREVGYEKNWLIKFNNADSDNNKEK